MILKTLRKHWDFGRWVPLVGQRTLPEYLILLLAFIELIPMVAAVAMGCVGATTFTIYAAITKPDVRWNKSSELPPFERVGPEDKTRLLVVNQEYRAIPEVQKLKEDIGPCKH